MSKAEEASNLKAKRIDLLWATVREVLGPGREEEGAKVTRAVVALLLREHML